MLHPTTCYPAPDTLYPEPAGSHTIKGMRLAGGPPPLECGGNTLVEGRLEIRIDGIWGLVCSFDNLDNRPGFGSTAAAAACRQLGFSGEGAHVVNGRSYAAGQPRMQEILGSVVCPDDQGPLESLEPCDFYWRYHENIVDESEPCGGDVVGLRCMAA